jgi:hypothetical protein
MSQYQFSPSQMLENGTFLNMQSDTQLQSQILSTFQGTTDQQAPQKVFKSNGASFYSFTGGQGTTQEGPTLHT